MNTIEKEKMIAGELYLSSDPLLCEERAKARQTIKQFNSADPDERSNIASSLFGTIDPKEPPFIEPPFYCDYGYNIHFGTDVFINFGCTILDCCPVKIGSRVLFGPNVQVYTATHPIDPKARNGTKGREYAKPITIEDDVWIGGAAVLCPGVVIGKGSVVAAGAVVTKNVEPFTVVGGNPAKFIKKVEQ